MLAAIPTNIITGFLGVGKTSAILHLLKTKPDNERWAVLVNEFGEIGVDGSLFQGEHSEAQEVYIREVPGGCMCCTAGLPMQIALSQLLAKARPHRLLIEPTGLGHPKEVLEVLFEEHNRDLLLVQKVITLVDARKLSHSRYVEHDTFNQQIAIADVIVGNKQDLYQEGDGEKLKWYLRDNFSKSAEIVFTQHGQFSIELLDGKSSYSAGREHHHHHGSSKAENHLNDMPIPDSGFIKAVNQGEGFKSVGWRFAPSKTFSRDRLFLFLNSVVAERLKAVFITTEGIYGYNMAADALTEIELDDCFESRIEIIASDIKDSWEQALFDCINSEL